MILEEERAYKELVIRRDILKLIFEMRCYQEMMLMESTVSCRENYIDYKIYEEQIANFSGWIPRLDAIVRQTEEGLVNLNVIREGEDDLHERVRELYDRCDTIAKSKIDKIEEEMIFLQRCCPNITTLCAELMKMSSEFSKSHNLDARIKQLLRLLPYRHDSSEREYLLHESSNSTWHSIYFFEKKLPKDEHQSNFDELISGILDRTELFASIIHKYVEQDVSVDSQNMKRIIETSKKSVVREFVPAIRVMDIMKSANVRIHFSITAYFDEVLEKSKDELVRAMDLVDTFHSMIHIFDYGNCLVAMAKVIDSRKNADSLYAKVKEGLNKLYRNDMIDSVFESAYNEFRNSSQNEQGRAMIITEVKPKKDSEA